MIIKDLRHINYRRGLFSVNDYFLTSQGPLNADLNYFIQCPENMKGSLGEFYTLLVDLQRTEEEIRAGIYHRTMTEIRSFIQNQNFEHKILCPVPAGDLDYFKRSYDLFAKEKKIRKAEKFRLEAYNKHGILAMSYIKQEDRLLCINIYRLTQERACNLHSFSEKSSLKTRFNNSHLGRAHRALHWLDILAFKKESVRYYDFGGWYQGQADKDLLSINTFKEQFTRHQVKEYTGVIAGNTLLKIVLNLLKGWKKI